MTNDTRSSDEIERDIENERARMSNTINDLQKKFSVETIVSDVGNMFRTQGGDVGRAISATVGRNPAAVAMVGVGLAWLLIGQARNGSAASPRDPWDTADHNRNRSTHDTWDRSEPRSDWQDDVTARDDFWYGNDEMARFRRARGMGLEGSGRDRSQGYDQRSGSSSGLMGKVSDGASAVRDAVTGAAQSMGSAMAGAAQNVGSAMSGAAHTVGDMASDMTSRLSHGLEGLSEDARSRVLAARRAAHDAREASTNAMKTGSRMAANFFDDQPLVIGALAIAVGAAMGGALPRTRVEDDAMGASSDQLFAQAQSMYREERDKAMAAVRMAASDAKEELRAAGSDLADLVPDGKNVGEVIVDRAAEAANRVYDRATGDQQHSSMNKSEI